MEFIYGKAPMYYIDGVPGYKAGEWEGLKSCKFGATRRIIRPKDQGIIFNEKEPLLPPRRKLLGPGPSSEYQFRPCLKMVNSNFERKDKPQGIRPIQQQITINKWDPEKRHHFQYLEEKAKMEKEKERKLTLSNYVSNEMRLMEHVGFKGRQNLESLTNRQLMGLTFKKAGNKITLEAEDQFFNNNQRIKDRKRDIEYVNNLNTWENKTLTKFNKDNAQKEVSKINETISSEAPKNNLNSEKASN